MVDQLSTGGDRSGARMRPASSLTLSASHPTRSADRESGHASEDAQHSADGQGAQHRPASPEDQGRGYGGDEDGDRPDGAGIRQFEMDDAPGVPGRRGEEGVQGEVEGEVGDDADN